MNNHKPQSIEQYYAWLKKDHGVEINKRRETHFIYVSEAIRRSYERSGFWTEIVSNIGDFNGEYLIKSGDYHLFPGKFQPDLIVKPYNSFMLKTFRKNVLENENWPDAPAGGWVTPENWFVEVNDIVRTLFIVKYLDGANFLATKIEKLLEANGLPCETSYEAREEGYYAVHLLTKMSVEIPKIDFDTEELNISLEIQITTQLQDVIRNLTHKYYEVRRAKTSKADDLKWQWDYQSNEFSANYLGHVLHYVEGMIMEVREKQKEE